MKKEAHIDGIWNTTEYNYKGRKILIKSAERKGMRAHAFKEDGSEVEFTLRFNFIKPDRLLRKVKDKIDKLPAHSTQTP